MITQKRQPPEFDWSAFDKSKYNDSIVLCKADENSNVKIASHEPYAQDLYNLMVESSGPISQIKSKDLVQGQVYKVQVKTIDYAHSCVLAEEVETRCNITIPLKEMVKSVSDLQESEEARIFLVNIYKVNDYGEYWGSQRKAQAVAFEMELFEHSEQNTWFDVKITKLIRGGYVAMYKNEVKCFIPGSHAAANVIRDFNSLLGKTLTVMVDNYDASNKLFILSYKKYITASMPTKVTDLKFDVPYLGILTNHPYDFGIFVEIDGYFTGLIHSSEFENYAEDRKKFTAGGEVVVYIKDVTYAKGKYRLVYTCNPDEVDPVKKQWQELRNRTENQSFPYRVNDDNRSINIEIDGEDFKVAVETKSINENAPRFNFVKVFKVDPINKRLNFEFVAEQSN